MAWLPREDTMHVEMNQAENTLHAGKAFYWLKSPIQITSD